MTAIRTESQPTFLSNLYKCLKLNLVYFLSGFVLLILSIVYICICPDFNWVLIVALSIGTSLMVMSVITIINCMHRIRCHKSVKNLNKTVENSTA